MADDFLASTSTTGFVSVGSFATGSIETVGDTDWFRITLMVGHRYQFDLQGSATGSGTLADPFLRLRDSGGTSITFNDDNGTNLNSRITYDATSSNTYYLSTGSATTSGTGTYRLSANDITPQQADLSISNISFSNSSLTPGGTTTVFYTLTNNGNAAAPGSTTSILMSLANGTSFEFLDSAGNVGANSSIQESAVITLSTSVPAGSYGVALLADKFNQIVESNEGNNVTAAGGLITVTTSKPDLVASINNVSTTSVNSGGTVSFTYSITNQGSAPAGNFLAQVYLSTDPTIDTGDIALSNGLISINGLNAGISTSAGLSVTVPASLGNGQYYIGLIADRGGGFPNGQIDESREDNNASLGTLINVVAPLANVTLAASVIDATEGSGQPLIFNVNLDRIAAQNVTVSFTLGGSASSNDYVVKSDSQVISGSIVVPAGSSFASISIYPNTDSSPEGNETVTVQLTGVSSGAQLGSTLTASGTIHDVITPPPGDDYRDSLTDTTASLGQIVPGGSSQTGVVVPEVGDVNGDKDVFGVTLQQGHVYRISVNGEAVGAQAALEDTYFTVRGSDFNTRLTGLYSNSFDTYDNAGGSNNALVEFGATQSGSSQYYIVVGAGGANFASAHGGYRLQIDDVTASEPGGTIGSAKAVAFVSGHDAESGFVGFGGDSADDYKIVAPAGGTLTVNLNGLLANLDVRLLDASGQVIGSSSLAGTQNEQIAAHLSQGQVAYVEVRPALAGAGSPYSMSFDFQNSTTGGGLLSSTDLFAKSGGEFATLGHFELAAYGSSILDPTIQGLTANGWQPLVLNVSTGIEAGGLYFNANAQAYVARASDALVVSFGGTNDWLDRAQWGPMSIYYSELKPLIDAVDNYVSAHPEITKIYVTGQSLGGAMVDAYLGGAYLNQVNPHAGNKYVGVTFADPGYNFQHVAEDNRITNFWNSDDIIQLVPLIKQTPGSKIHFSLNQENDLPVSFAQHSPAVYDSITSYLEANGLNDTSISQYSGFIVPVDSTLKITGELSNTLTGNGLGGALVGGQANDQYILNYSGGSAFKNTIIDSGGDNDHIFVNGTALGYRLESGPFSQDLIVDLQSFSQDVGKITIKNQFASSDSRVEKLTVGTITVDLPTSPDRIPGFFDVSSSIPLVTENANSTPAVIWTGQPGLSNTLSAQSVGTGINLLLNLVDGAGKLLNWFGSLVTPNGNVAQGVMEATDPSNNLNFSIDNIQNVYGGAGDDQITGDNNANTLKGGDGNDTVFGMGGADTIIGGDGAGNDTYDGGDGIDTVIYSSATLGIVVNLSLSQDQATGPEIGTDQITNIENVIGGSGDDRITGTTGANVLIGGAGNDILVGDAQASVSGDITAALQGTIVQFDGSGFDATRVQDASVVKTASGYALLYAGLTFGNNYQVGLATSSDGANWSKHSDNPVISNGGSQSWASFRELPATLMLDNGVYKLWFNGDNSNLSSDPGYKSGFGYATSTDGINWTFDANNPIRFELNSPSGNGIDLDEVVKLNGQYIAYYVNHNPSGDVPNYAVSADGIHFSNDSPLSVPAGYALLAATTANISGTNTVFAVLQDSSGIDHYATSTDGVNFTIGGIVNVPSNFSITDVLFDGSQIKFFGDNGVGNVNWSFGNTNIEYASALVSSLAGNTGALVGGNDVLTGGPGNDTIDGGPGIDTAIFAGLRSAYTITHIGNSLQVSGPDGLDTLTHIERLAFDDVTVPAGLAPTSDFNADGKSDLLFLNDASHGVAVWQMNGTQVVANAQVGTVNAADGWHYQDKGDFNGDGKTDLLLLNDTTHGAAVWLMDGTQAIAKPQIGTVNAADGWHYQATGDFNGDGKTDLLLLNDTTHGVAEWLMDGTQAIAKPQVGTVNAADGWHFQTTGDFNGDGKTDLLLLNDTTHGVAEWLMDGTQAIAKPQVGTVNAADGWHFQTTGDFNGDGKTDLLLLNDTTHGVAVWLMDGTQAIAKPQVGTVNAADGWHFQDVGDFNGDGKSDLLLLNDTTHGAAVWLMDGTQAIAKPQIGTINAAAGWHYDGLRDFNGDGKTDLLLDNSSTHGVAVWLMDGTQVTANPQVGTVNAADGWHLVV
jgi:CARDB/FG-GAP-like repeat/RTX calcium-binding nonapeptide repeat (4 copies)/Bacterial pre-peptidase C-terminal domain/Lipase (class 3)